MIAGSYVPLAGVPGPGLAAKRCGDFGTSHNGLRKRYVANMRRLGAWAGWRPKTYKQALALAVGLLCLGLVLGFAAGRHEGWVATNLTFASVWLLGGFWHVYRLSEPDDRAIQQEPPTRYTP